MICVGHGDTSRVCADGTNRVSMAQTCFQCMAQRHAQTWFVPLWHNTHRPAEFPGIILCHGGVPMAQLRSGASPLHISRSALLFLPAPPVGYQQNFDVHVVCTTEPTALRRPVTMPPWPRCLGCWYMAWSTFTSHLGNFCLPYLYIYMSQFGKK